MTELEQLRADLATLRKTSKIYLGACGYFPAHHDQVIKQTKERIADLEAQQEQADEWADSRMFVQEILADSSFPQRLIWLARYARHLEDQLNVATIRNLRTVEQLREKLAELTTIANAIPPACGLARELVEKRIEGVKKEIQNNG